MAKKLKKIKKIKVSKNESLAYLKGSRNYILFAAIIFLCFFLAGLFLQTPSAISEKINEVIKSLADKTSSLGTIQLIIFILQNNLQVSLFGMFFGIVLGIVPLILAISNGYVLGYVLKLVVLNSGMQNVWKILPHGIFELPAVLISLGLGIRLGINLLFSRKEFLKNLILSLKVLIFIILPLLIIAAIIEGSLIKLFG